MQCLSTKLIINHKKWVEDLTKTALQRFSKIIDWMIVEQSVHHHPIICIADSPPQAPALCSARRVDGAFGPCLLKAIHVMHRGDRTSSMPPRNKSTWPVHGSRIGHNHIHVTDCLWKYCMEISVQFSWINMYLFAYKTNPLRSRSGKRLVSPFHFPLSLYFYPILLFSCSKLFPFTTSSIFFLPVVLSRLAFGLLSL